MEALLGCPTNRVSLRAFRKALTVISESSGSWRDGQWVQDLPPKVRARPTESDARRILDWSLQDVRSSPHWFKEQTQGRFDCALPLCDLLAWHHGLDPQRLRLANCDGRMVICWLAGKLRHVEPDNPAQRFLDDLPRVLRDLKAGILACKRIEEDAMRSRVHVKDFEFFMTRRPAEPARHRRTVSGRIPTRVAPGTPSFKPAFFRALGFWTDGLDALLEVLRLYREYHRGGPKPNLNEVFDRYPELPQKARDVITTICRPPSVPYLGRPRLIAQDETQVGGRRIAARGRNS